MKKKKRVLTWKGLRRMTMKCKHCGESIYKTPIGWMHDLIGGNHEWSNGAYCPSKTKAEPKRIVPLVNPLRVSIDC